MSSRRFILLLSLFLVSHADFAPLSGSESAEQFFDKVAGAFLSQQLQLDLHHIPIYPTNGYSREVHRLLQVTANLYDSTTNHGDSYPWFPTCFRPQFGTNGEEVFISGYVKEEAAGFIHHPWRSVENVEDRPIEPDDNVYGIPIILGAKKGFPNFNEFAVQTVADVTRKLELRKAVVGGQPVETNQMFIVGISNSVAVELWHPWTNDYPRDLAMGLTAETTCTLTNDHGFVQTTTFTNDASAFLAAGSFKTDQFRVPLLRVSLPLSNSVFRAAPTAHFDPISLGNANVFEAMGPAFATNRWTLNMKTKLLLYMFDDLHLVDYVALSDLMTSFDVSGELNNPSGDNYSLWNMQSAGNVTRGVRSQIDISLGSIPVLDWNSYGFNQPTGTDKQKAIDGFRAFLGLAPPSLTNLVMQAPFTPTRVMVQTTTWEANDPLLHQCTPQLLGIAARPATATQSIRPSALISITDKTSIGRLNDNYRPWGGNPNVGPEGDPFEFDASIKDPGLASPEYWQFPSGTPLYFAGIGQVHRGTPWQSIYLKSESSSADRWQLWYGDSSGHPTNDWQLISILSSMLNPNPPESLLSVNSTDLEKWSAVFNGLVVSSNLPDCTFQQTVVAPDAPQISAIVDGINRTRASSLHGYFDSVGALLSTPELTLLSPWIHDDYGWRYCINDAALEAIPSQLLAKVRADPVATLISSGDPLQIHFGVLPGHAYEVQTSQDLQTWRSVSTNMVDEGSFSFSAPLTSERAFYRLKLSD